MHIAIIYNILIVIVIATSIAPISHPLSQSLRIDSVMLDLKKSSNNDVLLITNISSLTFAVTYEPLPTSSTGVEVGLCISKLFMTTTSSNILFLGMNTYNSTLDTFNIKVDSLH